MILIGERTALCKVLLSNQSTTVVQIKESETIQDLVSRVLEKRGITYNCFEVYTDKHPKVTGRAYFFLYFTTIPKKIN